MEQRKDGHTELFQDNLPNRLTIFRMVLIPLVITPLLLIPVLDATWTLSLGVTAACIFILAAITDFFDGYFARRRKLITVFGSFLDPIADKFLVVASLIVLHELNRIHTLIVIILILREMYMTSLRLLALNEGVHVPVNNMGKWKTTIQMMGVPMLMVNQELFSLPIGTVGNIFIYVAAFLSLYSAFIYSMNMVKKLRELRAHKKQQKAEHAEHIEQAEHKAEEKSC